MPGDSYIQFCLFCEMPFFEILCFVAVDHSVYAEENERLEEDLRGKVQVLKSVGIKDLKMFVIIIYNHLPTCSYSFPLTLGMKFGDKTNSLVIWWVAVFVF